MQLQVLSKSVIDLSKTLDQRTVSWGATDGLHDIRELRMSQAKGDLATASSIKSLSAHAATHVDAPCHFILVLACETLPELAAIRNSQCTEPSGLHQDRCSTGGTLENLNLDSLIGERHPAGLPPSSTDTAWSVRPHLQNTPLGQIDSVSCTDCRCEGWSEP